MTKSSISCDVLEFRFQYDFLLEFVKILRRKNNTLSFFNFNLWSRTEALDKRHCCAAFIEVDKKKTPTGFSNLVYAYINN